MMSNMETSVFLRAQLSPNGNRLIVNPNLEIPHSNPRKLRKPPRLRLNVQFKGTSQPDIEQTNGLFPLGLAQPTYQREIRKL